MRSLQTTSSIPWTWQNPRPDGNPFFAISCPTTTFCWAGGYSQLANTADGTTWTTQPAVEINAISCAATTHCVAVGDSGEVLTSTNGTTWSSQVINGGGFLLGVSCVATTSTCYATGAGGFIFKSTDSGLTWMNLGSPTAVLGPQVPPFFAISCGTTLFCVAVGPSGLYAFTTNGSTWTLVTPVGANDLYGVACIGPSSCVAVGLNGVVWTTRDPALGFMQSTESSGATLVGVSCPSGPPCFATGVDGSVYLMPDPASPSNATLYQHGSTGESGGLFAISCPTATTCFAAGDFGTTTATTNGGSAWTTPAALPSTATAVTCPGTTTCFAVAGNGAVSHTTDGSTWAPQNSNTTNALVAISCGSTIQCVAVGGTTSDQTVDGMTWTSQTVGGLSGGLTSVSCPTATVCFAITPNSFITSVNGGATWSAAKPVGAATTLTGISCPTALECFVSENTVPGHIYATIDGGNTWGLGFDLSTDPNAGVSAGFLAINCPDSTTCYAVGGSGLIATTNGTGWRTDFAGSSATINSISCPSAGVCYASANDFTVLHTADYGSDWDTQMLSLGANGISCVSSTTCYAVGNGDVTKTTTTGAAWTVQRPSGTTNPILSLSCFGFSNCYAAALHDVLVSHDGGNTWTAHQLGTTDQALSISCPAANTCFAVGWPGAIYTTVDGGTTWTPQGTLHGNDISLNSVSCADTTHCVAVGVTGIVQSTNDGSTWAQEFSNTSNSLFSVSCATTSVCVATGSGGIVTVRSSGTWTVHSSGTLQNLDAVKCATLSICYAVGRSGTVATSSTGGASWAVKTLNTNFNLLAVDCSQPTRCIAAGGGGTAFITTDGSTWVPLNMPTPNTFLAVQFKDTPHVWMAGAGGMILGIASCGSATVSPDLTSPQPGGAKPTFTATASGAFCTTPLFQWFVWSPATGYQMRQSYRPQTTFQLDTTGMAPGTYTIDVWVEQSGSILGTSSYETFALMSWVVGGCDFATVTPNPAPTLGTPMFTATAGGAGCSSPLFQFWTYSVATGWVLRQKYSPLNTWSIDTTTLAAATYSIDVWVKQAGSPAQYETWALSTIPKGSTCGATSITPTQASPQSVGGTIHLTAATSCGATPSYRYYTFPNTTNLFQVPPGCDISPTTTCDWNTAGYKPGTQSLIVHVFKNRPTTAGQAPDTWGLLSYSLLGCSSATIAAAPPSPQELGTGTVTFTATAGPCGTPQYQFFVYRPGGPWQMVQDWSSSNTFNWNTSGLPPGTYAWVVYVRQQGGGSAFDSFALTSYTTS